MCSYTCCLGALGLFISYSYGYLDFTIQMVGRYGAL